MAFITQNCVDICEALVQGKRCLVNADRFAIYVCHVSTYVVVLCEEFKIVYKITVGLPRVVYRLLLNKGLSNSCSSLNSAQTKAPAKRVGGSLW